jgi:hypothetical protein
MAVKDYQNMFPEEYQKLMLIIEQQRQNLQSEYAEIPATKGIKRALFSVSEKLSAMIGLKLTQEERIEFKDLQAQRWFCKEFPQFSLTKI